MSEEELLKRGNYLMSHGHLPYDTTTCETYGLSGNCGKNCPNFKNKTCDVYVDVLERINQELQQQNQKYKEVIDKSIKCIDYNNRYRNGADIYQFVDIKGEILEPLKDILEQNEENSNIYLKEFNDWLKEVE